MFPWGATKSGQTAVHAAKPLGLLPEGELILAEVTEAAEASLMKNRAARPLAEAANPEGALVLTRQWRDVDALIQPGQSVVHALLARYPRLDAAMERASTLLRRARRAQTAASRELLLKRMDRELKAFSKLKPEVAQLAEQSVGEIRATLQAQMEDQAFQRFFMLTPSEVRRECQTALDELEQALRNQRRALARGVDGRPSADILKARAETLLTILPKNGRAAERAVISSRIRRVTEISADPQALGVEFAKKLKRRTGRVLPALNDIEDSSLVFIEAIGVVASARTEGARLLRRYVEQGAASLKRKELERVSGYLGQMRGLMPEEVGTKMKFLESIFHKTAFEVLADFPPDLRGQMVVELVEGPLWVIDRAGAPRQFGDGCMLLTGPKGQSAIIGLGEFKAGFDEDLLHQLFVRSDGRAVDATVTFLGPKQQETRTLTREFHFNNGKTMRVKSPPTYVYGRPDGETPETATLFKEMVDQEMKNGREVWKVPVPFSASANEQFAQEALKEAVNTVKRLRKNWGR